MFALLMDGGLTVAKLLAFLVTGSSSILAETFHSGAETANQGLLLWGRHRAGRLTEEPHHPFGYSRERYFWPFIVSVLMFGVGSVGSLFEGIDKLRNPEPIVSAGWAFGILAVALVLDGASWVNAVRQARAQKRGSYWRFVRESRSPEVPMILLEDSAAVVGVAFAFVGVGLAVWTGDSTYDAIGSFAIGGLLAVVAWVLAREMKSLLIGESALPEEAMTIRQAIRGQEEVRDIVYLRTLYLGPDDLMIEAKVTVVDEVSANEFAAAIDAIEDRIRAALPHVGVIAIEPEIPRRHDPDRPAWKLPQDASGDGPPG